jgi:hypothetical protein
MSAMGVYSQQAGTKQASSTNKMAYKVLLVLPLNHTNRNVCGQFALIIQTLQTRAVW